LHVLSIAHLACLKTSGRLPVLGKNRRSDADVTQT
jgi:hypothetical protein